MSQELINHSPDLLRLKEEGFQIEISNGYLLVHGIPYVNGGGKIAYGILVSQLNLASSINTGIPNNHVALFQGEHPCDKLGQPIRAIMHQTLEQRLFGEFTVQHSFSNKPPQGYPDYYSLVTRYIEIISAPAISLDDTVSPKSKKILSTVNPDTVFLYHDANSSRSNIMAISEKLMGESIGIIGLGGTGSYILDLIAKTPVREIRLFDSDTLLHHNAFRAPGAASLDDLDKQLSKVEYYKGIYSRMHKNINAFNENITSNNLNHLSNLTCVFLCIDVAESKPVIIEYLLEKGISIIDVGMGVDRVDDFLIGTVRVTTATSQKNDHYKKRVPLSGARQDVYSTNIQIAELNALNASLAVIKWKKICGFYNDLEGEHNTLYSVNVSQLLNDDIRT